MIGLKLDDEQNEWKSIAIAKSDAANLFKMKWNSSTEFCRWEIYFGVDAYRSLYKNYEDKLEVQR